jgi:membrane-associated protein
MHYPLFLGANAAGGLVWGVTFVLLGYFVGERVEKATGIASYVLLAVIFVVIVFLVIRHRRSEKQYEGPAEGEIAKPESN